MPAWCVRKRKQEQMKLFLEHLANLESIWDSGILRELTSLHVARAKMWDEIGLTIKASLSNGRAPTNPMLRKLKEVFAAIVRK